MSEYDVVMTPGTREFTLSGNGLRLQGALQCPHALAVELLDHTTAHDIADHLRANPEVLAEVLRLLGSGRSRA